MEESRVEIRGADSTLRKEAYGRNFLQHCNSTTWTLCVEAHSTVYDGEGLEFKGVFISIAPDFFSEKNFMRELVRVDLQCGKRFVRWFFLQLFGLAT